MSLLPYSFGEISHRPAQTQGMGGGAEEETPSLSAEWHVYIEKKKLMALISETSYHKWAGRGNSHHEDVKTRRGPKGDLTAFIQGKSE